MNAPTPSRRCSCCCEVFPLERFRPRARGRHGVCNKCHAKQERLRRSTAKWATFKKYAAQIRDERNDRQVTTATALMIRLFGGVEGFVAAWHAHYQAAKLDNPAGRIVANHLLAISRLMQVCQPAAPDFDQMETEDLERELDKSIKRCLTESLP